MKAGPGHEYQQRVGTLAPFCCVSLGTSQMLEGQVQRGYAVFVFGVDMSSVSQQCGKSSQATFPLSEKRHSARQEGVQDADPAVTAASSGKVLNR